MVARADVDPRAARVVREAGMALHVSAMRDVRVLHLRIRASRPGATGPVESWTEIGGLRNAERFDIAPNIGASGWDGRDDWTLDRTGLVWADGGDADRYQTIISAFIHGYDLFTPDFGGAIVTYGGEKTEHGKAYDVLKIVAPHAEIPADLWIDRATHYPTRLVEVVGPTTYTENLWDYRPLHGLMVAFRENEFASGGEVTSEVVTHAEVNPSDAAARLAKPVSNVHDFSIDGDVKTTVPMDVVQNRPYVPVLLNGRGPFRFLFDTNGQNVIDPAVARELGAAKSAAVIPVNAMRVGRALLKHQVFYVAPVRAQAATIGTRADGVIGFEVLSRFTTTFDYGHNRLTLAMPGHVAPLPRAQVLPIVLDGQQPQFACAIASVPAECTANTGASKAIALFAPFVHDHPRVVPANLTVSIGRYRLRNVVGALPNKSDVTFDAPFVGGDIGGALLKRFAMTLDYHALTMTLASARREKAVRVRTSSPADRDIVRFESVATGVVELTEFGTNQPDAVDPIRPVTRVHLLLESGDNGRRFIALAKRHQLLASATLTESRTGTILRLVNVRVIGFAMQASGNNVPHRMSVELSVQRCSPARDDRKTFR
jgi:hypothetical protein